VDDKELRAYAAAHWLRITRTSDFKTAIDAALARFLPGFNIQAFWTKWRLGT
jgi:hypothetical protein